MKEQCTLLMMMLEINEILRRGNNYCAIDQEWPLAGCKVRLRQKKWAKDPRLVCLRHGSGKFVLIIKRDAGLDLAMLTP